MKVLVFDVETAPSTAYIWSLWQDSVGVGMLQEAGEVLCWCAKWTDSKRVLSCGVWEKGTEHCIKELHALIEEADAVVAHNGDRFDIKVMNTMFLKYGLEPPMPAKMIDTLKVAKGRFKMMSNKLDYIGEFLGLGRKIDTGGFKLWTGVMDGDKKARKDMILYNKQDVLLLEKVYNKFLPWIKTHPNQGLVDPDGKPTCTNCGGTDVIRKGTSSTGVGVYPRYKCNTCGTPLRGRTQAVKFTKEQREGILTQDKT